MRQIVRLVLSLNTSPAAVRDKKHWLSWRSITGMRSVVSALLGVVAVAANLVISEAGGNGRTFCVVRAGSL